MDHRTSPARLLVLAGFLAAVLLVYLGVLFNTQVTRHEEYLTQSIHSIAREEQVEASRGIITDRSGRTLVSNASAYDLTFDASLLKEFLITAPLLIPVTLLYGAVAHKVHTFD